MKFSRWTSYGLRTVAIATLTLASCKASDTAQSPSPASSDSPSIADTPASRPTDDLETLTVPSSPEPSVSALRSPETATDTVPDITLDNGPQPSELPSPLPTVPTTPIPLPSIHNSDASTTDEKAVTTKQLTFGTFISGEHPTQGSLNIVDDEGTAIILFGDDFQTSPGSDLVVILHTAKNVIGASTPPHYALTSGEYVEISSLKTPQGRQSYSIPAAIILDNYNSVAIWCRAFNTTFGAASLN